MKRVLVIGSGITGIVTGYYLAKSGIKVDIYEKESAVGGVGMPVDFGDFFLEKTYHAYFNGMDHLFGLLDELGLSADIGYGELKLGFINSKGVYPFAKPLDVLLNPNLSLYSKFKLAMISIKMAKIENWQELDAQYGKEWLIKHGTKNLWENLFAPLFKIKWGIFSDEISAAWIWSRIYPRAKIRKKSGKEEMRFLKNSSRRIYEEILELLKKEGCNIYLNSEVTKITVTNNKISDVEINKTKVNSYDGYVSTISPRLLFNLIDGLDGGEKFSKVRYMDNICVIMSTNNNFTHLGQIPVDIPEINFGGVINWTQLTGTDLYKGKNIYYVFSYLPKNSEIFKRPDEEIVEIYHNDLEKVFKKFDKKQVNFSRVFKTVNATPIFKKDYLENMPGIKINDINNLYLGGMFNIYPITDYNASIKIAKEIVEIIKKDNHV